MDKNGQVAWEYILFMAVTILISLAVLNYFLDDQELNLALGAARTGASNGALVNGFAIYPEATFNSYQQEKPHLMSPSSIKIIKIESINQGFSSNYNKIKIQLKVHATCPELTSTQEKNSVGDRINFNVRKSIAKCFNTEPLTNGLYNPVFSPKYVFTTADVKWI